MTDSFLQSMTFARPDEFLGACDCEECDAMPPTIRKFLDEKKRLQRASGPIKRTQQRTLVGRQGQLSLYCMHMPKNAEPLVEFGSSHRIVFVNHLAKSHDDGEHSGSTLKWIGEGIIGSSDEEESRKKMIEWTEGNVFLVPSNGGKAVGWICANDDSISTDTADNDDDHEATGTTSEKEKHDESHGFAVLYVAKIPQGLIDQGKLESRESDNQWANRLIEGCRDGLEFCKNQSEKKPMYYKFPDEISKLLKKAIREAEDIAAKDFDIIQQASKRIRLDQQVTGY